MAMQAPKTDFVFALCNSHNERALKGEIAASLPGWRSSYQRKGFVTFKLERNCEWQDLEVPVACARRLCLSLGRFKTVGEAGQALKEAGHLQHVVYEGHGLRPRTPELARELKEGDLIGTVVSLAENEHWAGLHRHAPGLSPDPGGDAGLTMPPDAPSRAWLKLEEAARFFALEFKPGELAVELGSAPGGVVHALLQRGVSVIGVDPAGMAEVVTKRAVDELRTAPADRAWFHHCRKPAALLGKRDLAAPGGGPGWLLSDMNLAPEVVLEECARIVKMAPSIHSLLITLKLGGIEEVKRKNAWVQAVREMGFGKVRLQQLAVHHKELVLLGQK